MKVLAIFQKIPKSVKMVILIVILSKLLVFSIGYTVTYMSNPQNIVNTPQGTVPPTPFNILMYQFAKPLAPQDTYHYLYIAQHWYDSNPNDDQYNFIVFFPLYPILVRLITFDFSYINLSALIVSNVSSVIALFYLFKLAKLDFDDGVAKKAVLFLSVFPTAYFLSAPYTEGLFFALAIASLYYARLGKWPLAGFLGFFAALTRIAGLVLLPTLLVEYLHQRGWKWRKTNANILWIGLPLFSFLIYLNINNQVTGNIFVFMAVQREHWFNSIDPIEGIKQALYFVDKSFPENITLGIAPISFAVFGALPVIWGILRRFRPSYTVYMLFTWLLAVSTGSWISVPRYVMAMFPMFIIFGLLTRRRVVGIAVTVVFLAALCFFTVLFALGGWAF